MRGLLLCGALALTLVGQTGAVPARADFEAGLEAFDRGYHGRAYRIWRNLAEEGHADAQHRLGGLYFSGLGVAQDRRQAVAWYRRAADQGHAGAQFSLGLAYMTGRGVERDLEAGVAWVRRAADRDLGAAQDLMGDLYHMGRGVERDLVRAHLWYTLAAEHGVTGATRKRERVAEQLSEEQLAEARQRRRDWEPARGAP